MDKITICINRLRGSQGVIVGRVVAEALNFRYLDRAIITHAANELGLDVDYVKEQSERPRSIWDSMAISSRGYNPTYNLHLPYDPIYDIFKSQTDFIKEVQEKENVVIVGHLANKLFENNPNTISIFLTADLEDRVERVMQLEEMSHDEALKSIERIDKDRDKYYKLYAFKDRHDLREYDLTLNVSTLGIEKTCELIINYIKTKFEVLR